MPKVCRSCCATSIGNLTLTVTGCSGSHVASGFSVSLSDGTTTIATGTTNSSGQVVLGYTHTGTHSVTVSGDPYGRYQDKTESFTINFPGTSTHTTNLSPAAGYQCCSSINTNGPDGAKFPVKESLTITDANGSYGLTYDSAISRWKSSIQTASSSRVWDDVVVSFGPCGTTTGDVEYYYVFSCGSLYLVFTADALSQCVQNTANGGLFPDPAHPPVSYSRGAAPLVGDGVLNGLNAEANGNSDGQQIMFSQDVDSPTLPFAWTTSIAQDWTPQASGGGGQHLAPMPLTGTVVVSE